MVCGLVLFVFTSRRVYAINRIEHLELAAATNVLLLSRATRIDTRAVFRAPKWVILVKFYISKRRPFVN